MIFVVREFLIFNSLFSDTKLKYQDADGNINIFNSVDEESTKFIPFQTLNGYKKIELTGKFALLITFFHEKRIWNFLHFQPIHKYFVSLFICLFVIL